MKAEGADARVTEEIVQFLIARLAEDEAAARTVMGTNGPDTYLGRLAVSASGPDLVSDGGIAASYENATVYIHPSRVLADVEAKRRIILERPWPTGRNWDLVRAWHDTTVRLFALQYAHHPDYREEEWRP